MESRSESTGPGGTGLKIGLAVVVVLAIVGAIFLATRSGDGDDSAAPEVDDTTQPDNGGDDSGEEGGNTLGAEHWGAGYDGSLPPARDAFGPDDDPLEAPDCDAERGRLAIPSYYAPNCVPLWPEGRDNGGATHAGVTYTEIVVAIYAAENDPILQAQVEGVVGESTTTENETAANRELVLEAYNALFETYGRTVRVETLAATGGANDEAAARADALRAVNEIGAFAVLGGPTTTAFAETLADAGVLCFCASSQPIDYYLGHAPYIWGDLMASTQLYVHRIQYVGDRLINRTAIHAGDESMQDQERRIAILYYETAEGIYGPGVDYFEEQLAEQYDYELADRIEYILDSSRLQEDATTVIARLKNGGITTVVFAGDPIFPITLTAEATNQEYFPEWIITGSTLTDTNTLARGYDTMQWRNAFGISSLAIGVDAEATQQEANLVSWFHGEELTSYPSILPLGRLFAGIHLAGPNLTPETFRDGLFSFKPVSGGLTRLGVSYGRGLWPYESYTAFDDATEIWWDPDAVSPQGSEGMYRYVNGGERFLPGDWVGDAEVFDRSNSITIYDERPEQDVAPRYPRRSGREG